MVEIYHAYKLLETLESDWLLELPDGLHLVRQGSSTMLSDAVPKEVYFGMAKLALGNIDYEAIITKALKQLSQVGSAVFLLATQDVVYNVHEDII